MTSLSTNTVADILRAYWSNEGRHRLYKKYGYKVLQRDNYRWKRKIMKRFGPNRAMALRIEMKHPIEETFLYRFKRDHGAMDTTYVRTMKIPRIS